MSSNYHQLSLAELQNVLYSILTSFADFCDNHNLQYYLFGGTLLGAVRHHDFIPWDDDIDVSMPRPDYEKFIELTNKHVWENYEVKQYTQPFIKMVDKRVEMEERLVRKNLRKQNAFIDIFPIDGLPDTTSEQVKHFSKIKKMKTRLSLCIIDGRKIQRGNLLHRYLRRLKYGCYSLLNYKALRDNLNRISSKYSYNNKNYVSVSVFGWAEKDISKKIDLEKKVRIHFRDKSFWCQGDYENNLRLKYGDYMSLPPENKRPPFHGIYYWKEGEKVL